MRIDFVMIYYYCVFYITDKDTQATAWSAFAMKANGSGTVQVGATALGTMDIQLNGVQHSFYDLHIQQFDGTNIVRHLLFWLLQHIS